MENESNIRPLTDLEKMTWYVNFLAEQADKILIELERAKQVLIQLQQEEVKKVR